MASSMASESVLIKIARNWEFGICAILTTSAVVMAGRWKAPDSASFKILSTSDCVIAGCEIPALFAMLAVVSACGIRMCALDDCAGMCSMEASIVDAVSANIRNPPGEAGVRGAISCANSIAAKNAEDDAAS